jgi:acetyl-CoA acetyltransferase family protein
MKDGIVIVDGVRTGFGAFGGALKDLSATDLGVIAAKTVMERAHVDPEWIDHVIVGNVVPSSIDAAYISRHVGLKSGVPKEKGALTLNRLCGSGQEAIISGARMILTGEADFVLAGGTESMSRAPMSNYEARWGAGLGTGLNFQDTLWAALTDSYNNLPMAITAENLASKYEITREDQDRLALMSQRHAKEAWDKGNMQEEIVPISLKSKKGLVAEFARDEHMRPDTTLDGLSKLTPRFRKEGSVTAGNASGIVDGAAMVVVTKREVAAERGLKPLGRLVNWGTAGVDPDLMGIGPAPAIRQALGRAGLKLEDMDLIEINEAFAAQTLSVVRELGIDLDKLNVNGGAIAIGHPLAATGARLTLTLLFELRRRNKRYGVASMCIGGGQGIAAIVENLS